MQFLSLRKTKGGRPAGSLFITPRSSGQHRPVPSTPWRGAQCEGCRGLPPAPRPGASARAQRSPGAEPGAPRGDHTLRVPTHNAAEKPKISASRAGTADSEVPPTAEGVYSKPYAQQGNSSFGGTPTLELGGRTHLAGDRGWVAVLWGWGASPHHEPSPRF